MVNSALRQKEMVGEFDKGDYYLALKNAIMLVVITLWGWGHDLKTNLIFDWLVLRPPPPRESGI